MLRSHHLGLLAVLAVACAPRAVTPNARMFAFDSPTAPAAGQADVQADLSRNAIALGPVVDTGGVRYRRGVHPSVVVEAEGGLLHLSNAGSGGSRDALTGRVGVMVRPPTDDGVRVAVSAGVGGGVSPAAGDWAAVDVGAAIGGGNRWVRPFIGGDLSYNVPLDATSFTVVEGDGDRTTLRLPTTFAARTTAGLEIGPPSTTFLAGFSLARMIASEPDVVAPASPDHADELVVAIGLGFRATLDD